MEIIDAQVHIWQKDNDDRPWTHEIINRIFQSASMPSREMLLGHMETFRRVEMTAERMLSEMAKVRVDAAIAVSSGLLYGTDYTYVAEAAARYPDKFAMVTPFDPLADNVENLVDTWTALPGAVGLRLWTGLQTNSELESLIASGAYDRAMRAVAGRMPVDVSPLSAVRALAHRFENLQIVVTHLGLPPDGDPTWSALPELLSLAVYPNVAVKATGVPVHSAEGYPFPDVWLPLHRVIDRFGIDRIMWGTDWTRITAFGYSDGVRYITETSELSLKEKEAILGKNLKTIMQWNRGTPKRNEKPKQSDR